MYPPLRLSRWHTLYAVTTRFELQRTGCAFALHTGKNFLIATMFTITGTDPFQLPALLFGKAAIHPKYIAGKNSGFVTTGTGTDFEETAVIVVWIFRQQQYLQLLIQLFNTLFCRFIFFLRHFAHIRVAVFLHFFSRG